MSKDKNTKMDAINNIVDGLNNIVSTEADAKEVVISIVKYVAIIVLVAITAVALLFSLNSFIAKATVFIVALLTIKGLLVIIWLKKALFISRGVMSHFRLEANSKDKEQPPIIKLD